MGDAWVNLSQGRPLASEVRQADSLVSRVKGLLGCHGLGQQEGLWLKPCRQVHTFFMGFAIDVIFVDQELLVVGVCADLKPWRLSPIYWRARSCLELAAGAGRWVHPGDQLAYEPQG